MLLQTLKTKLQQTAGTKIGDVYFEWKKYLSVVKDKSYPVVLWSMDNAKFKNDIRPVDIQKIKEYTVTVFAIDRFNFSTQDKIDIWDQLETDFYEYLWAINTNDSVVQIVNVDNIKGEYIPEGLLSADAEIGIMFTDVIIRTYC